MEILIINGPNLDRLGERDTSLYGHDSLEAIREYTREKTTSLGASLTWMQHNGEGEIVASIHRAQDFSALVINPGAYAHTSVAIHDALEILTIPKVEVHLTNTANREFFRSKKITARACDFLVEGYEKRVYTVAVFSLLLMGGEQER